MILILINYSQKTDRYLQREKSSYLKFKMKQVENELLGGSDDSSTSSSVCHFEDHQMLEDELKSETAILYTMKNVLKCSKRELERIGEENFSLMEIIEDLKENLKRSQSVNKKLRDDLTEFKECKCVESCGDRLKIEEEVVRKYELVFQDIANSLQLMVSQ